MLKREIKYEDFNGNQVSEIFYFNISKPELIELEVEYADGFGAMLKKIIDTHDNKELIKRFKELILMAYGIKSEDGKRFIKSDQLREEFSQTAAFQTLFMEIALDETAAANFIKGIIPVDMVGEVEQVQAKMAVLPPTPPKEQ